MKKRLFRYISTLCMVAFAFPLSGCTSNNPIDTNGEIEGNGGLSISYLSQQDNKVVINVFNFEQRKIVKTMQANAEIKDDGASPKGLSYYNPIDKKTVLLSNENSKGYRVYLQDQSEIKKLGLIKGGSGGAVFHGEDLYAIVYPTPDSCEVQKFHLSNVDHPLKTWKLKGEAQKILMDHVTGNVYVLSTEKGSGTLLTTVDKKGQCTSRQLFSKAYHLDATIEKNRLWLGCDHTLEKNPDDCEDMRKVYRYNLDTGIVEKELQTQYHPKFIKVDGEMIYLISYKNMENFVERINWKTGNRGETNEIDYETDVFGLVSNEQGQFVFGKYAILRLENGGYRIYVRPNGKMDRVESSIL